ncbi:MAG: FimB/Mfa2 family fimbrial subunit [Muribaculum sp.]|nr:FimB/Mfa2 family fimbrial subunit [Muribaculum sp.]
MTRLRHIIYGAVATAAICTSASCTMIQDDVDYCPTGLYVRFVYDYNTQRADMFKDHVGHVELYVYDEQGKKVAEQSVSNSLTSTPLAVYGYAMHFDPSQLPAGQYRLQAIALQRDWDEALATPGAKYRRSEVASSQDLSVSLDRAEMPVEGTSRFQVSAEAPLDTLWHTLKVTADMPVDGIQASPLHSTKKPYSVYPLEEQYVTVTSNKATYATVSLVRDTKHLNITLRQIDDPANVYHDDYELAIVDDNSHLAHDNEVVRTDSLHYSPYHSWTSVYKDGNVSIESSRPDKAPSRETVNDDTQRTAHYNIMFNRIIPGTDASNSARLVIRNKNTGKNVATVNLPATLAQGRMAYEQYNYTPQEYLDREYDYSLDFLLRGDTWVYCDIVINALSWSKRVQNVEL